MYQPNQDVSRPSKRRGCFTKRNACICLLILVVISAIAMGIIAALIPRIASHVVNTIHIDMKYAKMKDPGPNSFLIDAQAEIRPWYKVKATALPMTIELAQEYENSTDFYPFASMTTKEITTGNSAVMTITDQRVTIVNETAYKAFSNLVENDPTYKLRMRGDIRARVGIFSVKAHMNRVMTGQGFNGVKNYRLLTGEFYMKPLADGTNFVSDVLLNNPTTVSAVVGNLTVDVSIGGGPFIGSATIQDLVMHPGNNTIHVRSTIDPLKMAQNPPHLTGTTLVIDSTGESVIYNGVHIDFIEQSFKNNTFHTNFDIMENLAGMSIVSPDGKKTAVTDLVSGQPVPAAVTELLTVGQAVMNGTLPAQRLADLLGANQTSTNT